MTTPGFAVLLAPPTIWAGHFLACYVTAAVWCAKVGSPGQFWALRTAILGYTLAALAAVGWIAWKGQRHRGRRGAATATPFVGFVTVLLSLVSGIAIVYSGLTVFFFRSCA